MFEKLTNYVYFRACFQQIKNTAMKKFISLSLFFAMISVLGLQAQQQEFDATQIKTGKTFIPKMVKEKYHVANDTIWVIDSSYNYGGTYAGLIATDKWYVTERTGMGLPVLTYGEHYNIDLQKWQMFYKDTVSYYGDTAKKESYRYIWDDDLSKWMLEYHAVKTPNYLSLLDDSREYSLVLHKYRYGYKRTSTYDDMYNLTELNVEKLDTAINVYKKSSRNFYYYDIYGYDSLTVYEKWNDTAQQWETSGKVIGEYSPETNTVVKSTYRTQDNGQTWQPDVKYTIHYLDDDLYDTLVYAGWDSGYDMWMNFYRFTYKYDDQGRQIEYTKERYIAGDSSWVYETRSYYIFNGDKLVENGTYVWQSGEWKFSGKMVIDYENGLAQHQYYINMTNDTTPDTTLMTNYYYDEYSNLIKLDILNGVEGAVTMRFEYFWSQFVTNSVTQNKYPKLNIFPNPSTGIINVTNPFATGKPYRLTLTDLNGHEIFSKTCRTPTAQLNLEKQAHGIYLLKAESGSKVYISKVVLK